MGTAAFLHTGGKEDSLLWIQTCRLIAKLFPDQGQLRPLFFQEEILRRVREGRMADVVEQRRIAEGQAQRLPLPGAQHNAGVLLQILKEMLHELRGQMISAQGMGKPVVPCAGIDGAEAALLHGAQALEFRGVDDIGKHAVELDIAMYGIGDLHHNRFPPRFFSPIIAHAAGKRKEYIALMLYAASKTPAFFSRFFSCSRRICVIL